MEKQHGSKVLKIYKECDIEMCIYGSGVNAKNVLQVFSNYNSGYSLLSLCQLWCKGSAYYVKHVFVDVEGNYQYLLLHNDTDTLRRILILPRMCVFTDDSIGRLLSAKRLSTSEFKCIYERGDSYYVVTIGDLNEFYVFNWREGVCACMMKFDDLKANRACMERLVCLRDWGYTVKRM